MWTKVYTINKVYVVDLVFSDNLTNHVWAKVKISTNFMSLSIVGFIHFTGMYITDYGLRYVQWGGVNLKISS